MNSALSLRARTESTVRWLQPTVARSKRTYASLLVLTMRASMSRLRAANSDKTWLSYVWIFVGRRAKNSSCPGQPTSCFWIFRLGIFRQGPRAQHAQYHRDLPGMVNLVFHDSVEHSFVRIVAPRNLFRQILDGEIPNLLFEQLATLAPAGDEFVPGDRRLVPVLFGLPTRQRITVGGIANSFVPKE